MSLVRTFFSVVIVATTPGILSRDMIFDRCNMNDLATGYIHSSCSYYSLVSSVSCAASGPESISYHRCFGRIQRGFTEIQNNDRYSGDRLAPCVFFFV